MICTLTVDKYMCKIRSLLFYADEWFFKNLLFCDLPETDFVFFFSEFILADLEQRMSKNFIIFF